MNKVVELVRELNRLHDFNEINVIVTSHGYLYNDICRDITPFDNYDDLLIKLHDEVKNAKNGK